MSSSPFLPLAQRTSGSTGSLEWLALGLLIGIAVAAPPLAIGLRWEGSDASHLALEALATAVALMAGVAGLVRYFSRPDLPTLILGTAFLLAGLLDGFHAIASSPALRSQFPSAPETLFVWNWVLSRVVLGLLLLARPVAWMRWRLLRGPKTEVAACAVITLMLLGVVMGFSFLSLPPASVPDGTIGRPWDMLAAALFALALGAHLRQPQWHQQPLERWVVASLALSLIYEAAVMPFSQAPFDPWFNLAHFLKILSYVCVAVGLLFDVTLLLNRTEWTTVRLQREQMLFEQLARNIPDPIFFKDLKGRFLRVNSALSQMVGAASEDQLIGTDDYSWFPPDQARQFRADDARIMATRQPLINKEEAIVTADGVRHTLTTKMPLQDADGTVWGVFGVTRDVTDRVRATEKLHEATEQLQLALRSGNVGLWDWDVATGTVFYSPEFKAQLGLGADAPLEAYEDWEQRLHPDDSAVILRRLHDYLAGRVDTYEPTFRLRHADGSYRWIYSCGKLFRDPDGRPRRMLGVHVDLTKQILAEQRLQQFAQRLALPPPEFDIQHVRCPLDHLTLTDTMACGAAIRKLGSETATVSAFAERLVQLLHAKTSTDRCRQATVQVAFLITQHGHELTPELLLRAPPPPPGSGRPVGPLCLRLLATAGSSRAFPTGDSHQQSPAIPLASAEQIDAQPLVREILDQLRVERRSLLAPEPQIVLADDSPKVVFIPEAEAHPMLDDSGQIAGELGVRSIVGFGDRLPNGQLFVVLLYCVPEVWAETAQLLSHFALSTRMALLSLLAIDAVVPAKVQALDELLANHERIVAGQERELEKTLHQLLESKSVIERANAQLRRRSLELSQTNEQLDRRNQELDDFAYIASHDLKAPLRAIENLARWIEEDCGEALPPTAREHLAKLKQRANRMERLLEDLLQYSRIGRRKGDLERVDVGQVVGDLIEMHDQLGNFTFHVAAPLPVLETYRVPLEQTLRNLISNAIKHHDQKSGNIWIRAQDAGEMVEFTICDDGPGIDPKHHDRVFRMFQTLQPRDRMESSGMGLAIVKKLVDTEGGRVWIESSGNSGTGNSGTCFHFLWPKRSTARRAPEA